MSKADHGPASGDGALDHFTPVTRDWFTGAFAAPTAAQEGAWSSIARGDNTLVVAPTGSGKTLAAFLWSLDRLASEQSPSSRARRGDQGWSKAVRREPGGAGCSTSRRSKPWRWTSSATSGRRWPG